MAAVNRLRRARDDRPPPARGVLPLLLSLFAAVSPLAAQQPEAAGAVLRVRVVDRATQAPIAGARVAILDTELAAETGADGRALLTSVEPGPRIVEIGSTGFGGTHVVLDFAPGDTLELRLALAPQGAAAAAAPPAAPAPDPAPASTIDSIANAEALRLEGLEVVAERRVMALEESGFYERRETGFGSFFTAEEVEERARVRLSDALRGIPGVRVLYRRGRDLVLSERGARRCLMRIFVDGVPWMGREVNDVPVRDVEAMEVYRGAAEIPPRFNLTGRECGAVVIWTKRGGGR